MSGVIIKAGDARAVTRGLYSLDLRDIAEKAESMLAAARAEAESIIAAARAQARTDGESIRQAASDEGFAKGFAEGQKKGEATALDAAARKFSTDQAQLLKTLQAALLEFSRKREQLYVSARRDVVVLAIAIAARIAKRFREIEDVAPHIAAEACAGAMSHLREATDVLIAVNPADAAAVEQLTRELSRTLKGVNHVRMVEDADVARGGVRVSTADTSIDAAINSRVERIADDLVETWRERLRELPIEP